MARFGEMLGWGDNPIYDVLKSNRNAITQLGAGIAANGLAGGAEGIAKGAIADDAYAVAQKAEADRQAGLNSTIEFMRSKGYDDLIAGVEGGGLDMGTAWSEALKRSAPGYNAGPEPTANMRDFQYAQENPGYADFINPANTPSAPSGYRWNPDGTQSYVPGGPNDPATRSSVVPMNSTIQKELFEADDAIKAGSEVISGLDRALQLNDTAYDGPFADQRSAASALFGDQGGIATQELKNVVTAQALESLKAVFGGMPTEGERKILLEIQGSVDQPKPVREAIYTRARAAAERRIAENQAKADALRSGQYFDSGYAVRPSKAPNTTSSGLSWSIEP